jgi:protoporphyrinogen oxidase
LKIIILGAGVMGLAAAFELLDDGHEVTLLEAGPAPGGMAGSFDFGGVRVEKYYHFICGADHAYFRWLKKLGLSDRLCWRPTTMAVHLGGRLHPFGDPLSLLSFDAIPLADRFRYGWHAFSAMRRKDWKALENVRARDWLLEGVGELGYRAVWEPLLRQKFGAQADSISAAWIWSRIHRLGSSRDRAFRESLGYVRGGSDVLVEALTRGVTEKGGEILCSRPADALNIQGERLRGVRAGDRDYDADAVVSTIPLPILVRIGADLPEGYRRAALDLDNIGVRCIVLKLKRPLSSYFWINVNDDAVPLCGLIEYTNLNPSETFGGYSFVYSPLYAPSTHPEYLRADEEVFEETVEAIGKIRSDFDRRSVVDYRVFREPHAQPVCPVGFTSRLAPIRTPTENLVAADTTHLLPHDRSISDSLTLESKLVAAIREIG